MNDQEDSISILEQIRLEQPTFSHPATKKTPLIEMDYDNGYFLFSGRSIPKYASGFYYPILEKIDRYIQEPNESNVVVFFMEYLDSASSRLILSVIQHFKKLVQRGLSVRIEWHYLEDDDDIFDTGKTYSELSGLDFKFVCHYE
jgi:hypothetical protein